MIKTEKLSMLFTTEEVQTKALNEVTLHVEQGEFVAIMGPSGCGKSTLLNILGTLDSPTSGSYFFEGKQVDKMNENQLTALRKNNLGFIFQSFNLIDELTVYENVELPLVYMGIKTAQRKEKVNKVLEKVNLLHRANHYPQQLSGGQQQRVAIARAVVTDCKLLLADRKSGFGEWRGSDGAVERTEPPGDYDYHCHPLSKGCDVCASDYPVVGRTDCIRKHQPSVRKKYVL